ncbi:MAG: aldo/keto reductase, partial [Mycobacteriaceae bacterium]|nr:aldo/keto reductase [Mycobacteriaceae bacterium]
MTPTESSSPAKPAPTITLNDDNVIPVLGLGVAELSDADTERAVTAALESGYRLIDTASAYRNEVAVGRAIATSGVAREELFVTTKVATADQGFTSTKEALAASLQRLGLDYVDMYMIHWPAAQLGKYVDTYGAMQILQQEGKIHSIGFCNFLEDHLSTISDLTYTNPAVNQIELHPLLNQAELRAVHADRGIITEAYSPLGV